MVSGCEIRFKLKTFKNLIFSFDDISGFGDILIEKWQEIATENWKFCFAIVFGLMMAVIMPLAGIVWYLLFTLLLFVLNNWFV